MGICTSSGVIRDFAGPYYVSEDSMAFGNPTRYWRLDPAKAQAARLRAIEGLVASGAAITEVEKSDAEYLKNCVPMKKN